MPSSKSVFDGRHRFTVIPSGSVTLSTSEPENPIKFIVEYKEKYHEMVIKSTGFSLTTELKRAQSFTIERLQLEEYQYVENKEGYLGVLRIRFGNNNWNFMRSPAATNESEQGAEELVRRIQNCEELQIESIGLGRNWDAMQGQMVPFLAEVRCANVPDFGSINGVQVSTPNTQTDLSAPPPIPPRPRGFPTFTGAKRAQSSDATPTPPVIQDPGLT